MPCHCMRAAGADSGGAACTECCQQRQAGNGAKATDCQTPHCTCQLPKVRLTLKTLYLPALLHIASATAL